MDPLSDEIWKLKPEERKKRMLAFPFETAGEIAGKTGTATNADGKTSDVWLILWIPGPPDHPEKGVVLGFWMGKDSKDHPLGERGSTGGPGLAESGGRNWVHSASTVLAFLQKERGLLRPGNTFQPIIRDDLLMSFEPTRGDSVRSTRKVVPEPTTRVIIDPSDPTNRQTPGTQPKTSG
jgi:membrane peptidoglycan carboxypeptidase